MLRDRWWIQPHEAKHGSNARQLINFTAGIIHQRNALASGFLCATGFASVLPAEGLQVGFEWDTFAKAVFDTCYVQASDREDTGFASGTRHSPQVQEPRANARRLIV